MKQDPSEHESKEHSENFSVEIPKKAIGDPRAEFSQYIDDKFEQLRLYNDRPDRKEFGVIQREKEIKKLQAIEQTLELLADDWEILVKVSAAINQLSNLTSYDGVHLMMDFTDKPRSERYAFLKLS